ncbi:MAG: xanthine dehydrogenase accessory factor [Bacteroidota bacterium]|nr:xanthine dehydrogenase accessory factor [Bacteroidota bacterium]
MDLYEKIAEIRKNKEKAVLCTVVAARGSVPRKIGAKMLVFENLRIFGTIGGGTLEKTIIESMPEVFKSAAPKLITYNLSKDLGMSCGGSVDIFAEPLFNSYRLYIFGAGHVGKALAKRLTGLNFDISVIDGRQGIFDEWDFGGFYRINIGYDEFLADNRLDERTFVVIVTPNHLYDSEVLRICIKQPRAYLGMMGSKKKVAEIKKQFIENGWADESELSKVDMPIGLEIAAEGPDEIAISIAGKLILVKNNY